MRHLAQFIKFAMVGLSNTIVSLVVYYGCVYLGMHYLLANALGFIISVWNAYYWSSRFVFIERETKPKKTIIKTFISYGFTFILSSILLIIFVQYLHISDKLAPIINLCVTLPLNFMLNKFWVYK